MCSEKTRSAAIWFGPVHVSEEEINSTRFSRRIQKRWPRKASRHLRGPVVVIGFLKNTEKPFSSPDPRNLIRFKSQIRPLVYIGADSAACKPYKKTIPVPLFELHNDGRKQCSTMYVRRLSKLRYCSISRNSTDDDPSALKLSLCTHGDFR